MPDDADDKPKRQSPQALAKVLDRALRRFDTVAKPQQELRAQSLEARRFVTIPGAMWEGAWGVQFENAPRPEVDKITKSLEKIETDYRENRLIVDFRAADSNADTETADTLDGMYRADAYEFKAQQAYDNAFQEAIRGGFGAFRLTCEYANPDDPDDETQRVNPGMVIVDADQSVYFDGASKLYDKSDAEWAVVISADPRDTAKDKWGAENIADWPLQQWKYAWDWYTPDIVRTAEYYECEHVREDRITLTNPFSGEVLRFWDSEIDADELAKMKAQGWERSAKPMQRKRVHKYILNGTKVLKDCGFVAGDMIPIVPVYGRRDFVDNMERWRGHVGKKMDRQRIYNTGVAKVVELQSIAPYEVPILAAEQLAGAVGTTPLTQIWSRGNIDRIPYRIINPLRDGNGDIVSGGPLGKIEPPQVQPATAALLQISAGDLADDDQNADEVKANVSAEAMDIAAQRVDLKSAIYLDNMAQSLQRAGEIYQAMARAVYFEEGREVDTLTDDGQDSTAKLYEPVLDTSGVYRIRNDLTKGRYKVVATVQEATTTKRQKTVKQNMTLAAVAKDIPATQDLAAAALLVAVYNQDGEGQDGMREFARKKLIELGVEKPTPEEAQQMAQAAQEQQQPSAADQALGAQARESDSKAILNQATAMEKQASARLKEAQAAAVGGPVEAPDTPTGLDQHPADIADKEASANLKDAQAEKIRHDIHTGRIMTGHQIEMDRRAADAAERAARAN